MTIAITLTIAAISIIGAIATRHGTHNEERNLLDERASEIGLILTSSFSTLQTQLATTAAETKLNGANGKAFLAAADAIIQPQPGASTTLVKVHPSASTPTVRYVASTGTLPTETSGPRAQFLAHALSVEPPDVSSAVFAAGRLRQLAVAYPVGVRDLVVLRQLSIDPQAAGSATAQGQPFHELNVALYVGTKQDPSTLVLTTAGGAVPLTGSVATSTTPFGADDWLVAVKPTSPLVGAFAANAFWLVLGGGILIAIAIGALVETLARRRDYALTLVDERTEELRQSVEKLEEAQDQLLRQERLAAIGELASAVGHELRNPLGVITNAHYLLRSNLDATRDEAASRHLATAEREVGAATLIVSDLLDYSRAREPVMTTVQLADLVEEVRGVIPAPPGITVTTDLPTPSPTVRADRDQLRQVLLNLLSNSYEAMPEGGTITITAVPTGDSVELSVRDTGSGMDEDTARRVFEPFFTRKARGIGLGLAVTKRIVDGHGGTISVTSTPGAGAAFTVRLPAAHEPAPS